MNICIEKQKEIEEVYKKFKNDIDMAIKGYAETIYYDEKDYFAEIAFCILTRKFQMKALKKIPSNSHK